MTRVRIKICGITRSEDLRAAVAAGADALGFVFAPRSPRRLSAAAAAALAQQVPAFVTRVGLFMDQPAEEVQRILTEVPLELLQFHGQETGEYCRGFGRPYIKAVAMAAGADLGLIQEEFADAAALLLDSHQAGEVGGSGRSFDWSKIPPLRLPLVLAGGLTPENVAAAVRQVEPWAVDVASGVEDAPGVKNGVLIEKFINEVRK